MYVHATIPVKAVDVVTPTTLDKPAQDDPALDNAELAAGWRRMVELHNLISRALDASLQRDSRISLTEFEVLDALGLSPDGDLRMQELADVALLSQSALSRLIGRLEDAGLVERVVCEDDRRGRYIGITAKGREQLDTLCPLYDRVLAETVAAALLRPDLADLARALTQT
jgi:DNA-binding MarR family transcriptional regulator